MYQLLCNNIQLQNCLANWKICQYYHHYNGGLQSATVYKCVHYRFWRLVSLICRPLFNLCNFSMSLYITVIWCPQSLTSLWKTVTRCPQSLMRIFSQVHIPHTSKCTLLRCKKRLSWKFLRITLSCLASNETKCSPFLIAINYYSVSGSSRSLIWIWETGTEGEMRVWNISYINMCLKSQNIPL